MNIAIITCFESFWYETRIKHMEEYLTSIGHSVTFLCSDFEHREKKIIEKARKNQILIPTPAYKKNMSLARINSHRVFAKLVLKELETIKPDLIYSTTPPNFLFFYLSRYKRKNRVKLIFEIGDMWPESLPISGRLRKLLFLPLYIWKALRNSYLSYGDYIVFECNLFRERLKALLGKKKSKTLYLCKQPLKNEIKLLDSKDSLRICYLGSVSNIIDIGLMVELIAALAERIDVSLHIVGGGENIDLLLRRLKATRAKVGYHGLIYDSQAKAEILENCHFALNILKEGVCVGLTMKSLDYFELGLPIINSVPFDTEDIINRSKCGCNITPRNIEQTVEKILSLSLEELNEMRRASRQAFDDNFSPVVFKERFREILEEV